MVTVIERVMVSGLMVLVYVLGWLEELTKRKGGLDSFNGLVIVFCLIYNF